MRDSSSFAADGSFAFCISRIRNPDHRVLRLHGYSDEGRVNRYRRIFVLSARFDHRVAIERSARVKYELCVIHARSRRQRQSPFYLRSDRGGRIMDRMRIARPGTRFREELSYTSAYDNSSGSNDFD